MSIENDFQRVPASISQTHHLLHQSLDILSFPAAIQGKIDPERMTQALKVVIEQYPILRSRFGTSGKETYREACDLSTTPITFLHWPGLSKPVLMQHILELAETQRQTLPKRSEGPLFHCVFVEYAENASIFLLTIDHLICDAWSIILFAKTLFTTYENAGKPAGHSATDGFHDFVLWQNNKVLRYQPQLQSVWDLLWQEVPLSNKHAPLPSSHTVYREHLKLSIEDSEQLTAYAEHHKVSLFIVILTVFKQALLQLQLKAPIRMVHSGRFRHPWKSAMGLFASSLWLDVPVRLDTPLEEALKKTQSALKKAVQWAFVPSEHWAELGCAFQQTAQIEIDYMPIEIFSHQGKALSVTTFFDESLEKLQPDLDMQCLCYHHHQQLCFYFIYKDIFPSPNVAAVFQSFLQRPLMHSMEQQKAHS